MSSVTIKVDGYPPAKNEALSMLGKGHSHADRVRALLRAARDAAERQQFVPIEHGKVAMDVVVSVSDTAEPWDVTNYLGGIGDVLENKVHRGASVFHLGELVGVWLYRNDRQIRRVTYREEPGPAGYQVTIGTLDE